MFIDLSYPQKKSQRYENKFAFFSKILSPTTFPASPALFDFLYFQYFNIVFHLAYLAV